MLTPTSITQSINLFIAHIVSELHLDTDGDYYNVIADEIVGVASIGSFGRDRDRPDSPNRKYFTQKIEVLAIKGYVTEQEYKNKVPVELIMLPSTIAKYNAVKIPDPNFYGVRWDGEDITPVPRQLLRNQYDESPEWIIDIPFGVVLHYQTNVNKNGEYID
jgi:hypothetical protein